MTTVRNAYFIGSGPFDAEAFQEDLAADEAQAKAKGESFHAYFIGCDRGARRFVEMEGERPPKLDLAIGDYDSITEAQRQVVLENAGRFISLPAEKDETDTEAAINEVINTYPPMDHYLFYGMLAGRLDHTLHNVWLGRQPRYQDVIEQFEFRSDDNVMTFLKPGSHILKQMTGMKYLSFIALETVTGLDLIEAKYPLANYDMPFAQSMISNEFIGPEMTIQFKTGIMLALHTRDAQSI